MNGILKLIALPILIFINESNDDFEFFWKLEPSFENSYQVRINVLNGCHKIAIKKSNSNDSVVERIDKDDCDILISFLDKYNFPIKGNVMAGEIKRNYLDTKFLQDTSLIIVQGDTIRRSSLSHLYYEFDKDSNKCYIELQEMVAWTDGHSYKGYLSISNTTKSFSVYGARTSKLDYQLNKMVVDLICKYDIKTDYSKLKNIIDMDNPKE